MSSPRRAGLAAVACFVVGAAGLLLAEPDLIRMAAAFLLLAAMVAGVTAIATPELLGRETDEDGPG